MSAAYKILFLTGIVLLTVFVVNFFHEYVHYSIYQKHGVDVEEVVIIGFFPSDFESAESVATMGVGWVRVSPEGVQHPNYVEAKIENMKWDCLWYGWFMDSDLCERLN